MTLVEILTTFPAGSDERLEALAAWRQAQVAVQARETKPAVPMPLVPRSLKRQARYLIFVGSLLWGGTVMNGIQSYQIGRHKMTLALREDVGPVSPYSLLLAENISDLTGQTVVDVGSGSGFLSIVARLQGATRVYLLDTYESAIALALENAERNRVREGLIHLPIGSSMIPLPEGERVNVIISNPAQLPLPQMERENSPFYAGPEGRSMIEAIIKEAPNKLAPSGRLLMTHNSMANLSKSLHLFESVGMQHRVLAKRMIAFRSFIDRKWLDTLGGEAAGLYSVKDDVAYEALYVLEAQLPD